MAADENPVASSFSSPACITVGVDDLKGLLQLKRFYTSTIVSESAQVIKHS